MFRTLALSVLACTASVTLMGCDGGTAGTQASASVFGVTNLSLRVNANPDAPSGVTFAFNGGPDGGAITGVTSPDAARVEMHETRQVNGMTTMVAIDRITVAANQRLAPRERGLHLMVFGLSPEARANGQMRLVFQFADGSTFEGLTMGATGEAANGDHSGH